MKRKWIPETDEFFVGYFPEAPEKTAIFLRWMLMGVGAAVVIISLALVISQQKFSSSQFDYGKYTSVEGYIFSNPVPHLKLKQGSDSTGKALYQTVLLVGFGKAGADRTIAKFESQLGTLEGKFVKISGQLIHGHGKALLQLSEERIPEILSPSISYPLTNHFKQSSMSSIRGEVVDPKCFFGVMKPGEGKPHRSCAIRCISGGIPPVFHATELSDYFLLLDENFKPVNDRILDIVGDQVELTGNVVQWDDWKILLIKKESLKNQAIATRLMRNLAAMEDGMTQCGVN